MNLYSIKWHERSLNRRIETFLHNLILEKIGVFYITQNRRVNKRVFSYLNKEHFYKESLLKNKFNVFLFKKRLSFRIHFLYEIFKFQNTSKKRSLSFQSHNFINLYKIIIQDIILSFVQFMSFPGYISIDDGVLVKTSTNTFILSFLVNCFETSFSNIFFILLSIQKVDLYFFRLLFSAFFKCFFI